MDHKSIIYLLIKHNYDAHVTLDGLHSNHCTLPRSQAKTPTPLKKKWEEGKPLQCTHSNHCTLPSALGLGPPSLERICSF